MYRRVAATAALAMAGLTVAAPLANAATPAPPAPVGGDTATSTGRAPGDVPPGSGNVELLNGLNLLPVQACGLGIPILSGILDSPDASCSVDNDAAQHNN